MPSSPPFTPDSHQYSNTKWTWKEREEVKKSLVTMMEQGFYTNQEVIIMLEELFPRRKKKNG